MGKRKYRDITVRGVTYPTLQAAGRALGVQPQTVLGAMKNGTLDDCGLRRVHPKPMPVCIRGVVYKTAREAAEAHGVTPDAIYTALNRGTLDRLGLKAIPDHTPVPPRPFTVGGMRWPSMRAASKALGFEPNYIARAYSRDSAYQKQRILAAAMRLRAARDGMDRTRRAA